MSISVTKLRILLVSLKYLHQDTMYALVFVFKFAVKMNYTCTRNGQFSHYFAFLQMSSEYIVRLGQIQLKYNEYMHFFKVTI